MIVGPSSVLNVSSSGLIYAGIVGAWAVYLVPVWLRREEQLNEAREKARYAAAIRTLGRSERFEKKVLAEEALAATGTDGAPPPRAVGRQPKVSPVKPSARKLAQTPSRTSTPVETRADAPAVTRELPKTKLSPAAQTRRSVTARLPRQQESRGSRDGRPAAKPSPSPAATAARRRGILLMRRRRVVAFLFTLATFGALVSITLGVSYSWAMIAPATLFSGYIVYIRRDEKQRTRERYRRRQAVPAAERRREGDRERQRPAEPSAPPRMPAVAEPETSVWRPAEHRQEYRRAANG